MRRCRRGRHDRLRHPGHQQRQRDADQRDGDRPADLDGHQYRRSGAGRELHGRGPDLRGRSSRTSTAMAAATVTSTTPPRRSATRRRRLWTTARRSRLRSRGGARLIDKIVDDRRRPDVGGDGDGGDMLAYTFTVTNDGNVTLTNVTITEIASLPVAGHRHHRAGRCDLAPGESAMFDGPDLCCCSQADIDSLAIDPLVDNVAQATGSGPNGDPVDSNQDPAEIPFVTEAALSLLKDGVYTDVGGDGFTPATRSTTPSRSPMTATSASPASRSTRSPATCRGIRHHRAGRRRPPARRARGAHPPVCAEAAKPTPPPSPPAGKTGGGAPGAGPNGTPGRTKRARGATPSAPRRRCACSRTASTPMSAATGSLPATRSTTPSRSPMTATSASPASRSTRSPSTCRGRSSSPRRPMSTSRPARARCSPASMC